MKSSAFFIFIIKLSPFLLLFGMPFLISCSTCVYCTDDEKLDLQYYSEGGFTGGASGVSIDSTGTANFWTKNLNGEKTITRTIKVKKEKLDKICSLLEKPDIFTYKNNFVGNYTTYLIIKLNGKENSISFNKSELPENMPEALKLLVSELNSIE